MTVFFVNIKYIRIITAFFIIILSILFVYLYRSKLDEDKYVQVFAVQAGTEDDIEIFDVIEERVIKTVKTNSKIINEAKNIMGSITGIYIKVNALPSDGYIIKIPFTPELKADNKWFVNYGINSIGKLFVVMPENKDPYLIILDSNERPYLFNFSGKTEKLLKLLDFERHQKSSS